MAVPAPPPATMHRGRTRAPGGVASAPQALLTCLCSALPLCCRYGASRVRVGRNSDNHTRGWAHVSVARAKADEAIAAVNGRLGLVMGINEHNRRDTCTVVEVEAGTQGNSDGGGLDGSDAAHSGAGAATPKPYVLLVTRVVGKVDVLFPDFTREQRLALRMDPVAMFSVTDQCVACMWRAAHWRQPPMLDRTATPGSRAALMTTRPALWLCVRMFLLLRYSADRISEFARAIIEVGAQRQATVEEPCTRRLAVTDATACVGGNTLSFARYVQLLVPPIVPRSPHDGTLNDSDANSTARPLRQVL